MNDSTTDPSPLGIAPCRPEAVAGYSMTIVGSEGSPEASMGWGRRAEALAAWLLAEWQREQKEGPNA